MRDPGIELFRVLISVSLLAGVVYFQFMVHHNLREDFVLFHRVSYLFPALGVAHASCLWLFEEGLSEAVLHTVALMSSGIACIWLRYNMHWLTVSFLVLSFVFSVWGLLMRKYLEQKSPAQWAVIDVALGNFGSWILFLCAEIVSEVTHVEWPQVVASVVLSAVLLALPSPCMSVLGMFMMDVSNVPRTTVAILSAVSCGVSSWNTRSVVFRPQETIVRV